MRMYVVFQAFIHMFIHVHKQKLSLTKIFIGEAILLLNTVLKTLF